MKTIQVLAAMSLAFTALLGQSVAQRTPVAKVEVDHVGQVPRLFEVRDLLREFGREYVAPELGIIQPWRPPAKAESTARATEDPPKVPDDDAVLYERGARNLVEFVKTHIQPQIVEPLEHVECAGSGTLVAQLMPTQHAWVEAFLRRLRDFDGFIEVETRIVEAPEAVLDELGLVGQAVLSAEKGLATIDGNIKSRSDCNLISTPRIMTAPGARASLSTTEEFKFVQDWVIEKVEPNDHEIAVPQIAVIREGTALEVRALPVENDLFAVDVHLQSAKVRRPLRTVTVPIGPEQKQMEIGLTEVNSAKFQGTLLLASGSSTCLRGGAVDKGKAIALIVTVRKVPRERR